MIPWWCSPASHGGVTVQSQHLDTQLWSDGINSLLVSEVPR
jgi:hypothetical protein